MNIRHIILAGSLSSFVFLSSCASKDQVADTLKNNPEILAEAIRKNPSVFMEALREAAQADQKVQMEKAGQERHAQMEKDLKNPRDVKIDPSRIVYGDAGAPITIVKYADFQCPACRMGFNSLEEVKKKYPGKIRFIHKNIPLDFHKLARPAALIYEGLVITDKAKALAFYKEAYSTQEKWVGSKEKLMAIAIKLGVKKAELEKLMAKKEVTQHMIEDEKEFASLGFEGTPGYVINGVALYGAQSPEEFAQVIERSLKK